MRYINGISTYASHKILNFLLGRQSLILPSIFFIGVSTTPVGIDGIGATEPTDLAYKRLAIINDKTYFSHASNKIVSIIKECIYPQSTTNWGKCTHFVIYDNNIGGNVWFYGNLQESRDVEIECSLIIDPYTNQFCIDICNDINSDNVCDGSTSEMAITTYASNKIANYIFGNSPILIPPDKFYMGVSSTPLSPDGIGATEPTGGGYKRLELPNDKNTFIMASNKAVTFAKEFRFQNSETPWGNMKYFFVSDTPVGESVWWTGKLKHGRNVEVSTTLTIKPDGFTWRLDNCTHSDEKIMSIMSSVKLSHYWG